MSFSNAVLFGQVAGISVGLVTKNEESALLVDILGTEDHHGDMDFKVPSTFPFMRTEDYSTLCACSISPKHSS